MQRNHRALLQQGASDRSWRSPVTVLAALAMLLGAVGAYGQDAVRVPSSEGVRAAIKKADPEYPPMAKQMNISGTAEVDVFVNTDGTVEKVDIVKGNPLLTAAAASAAKNWKFTPFKVEGAPAKAVFRLAFDFAQ